MRDALCWVSVIGLWACVAHACLQTTQGTYEDHVQIAAAKTRERVLTPRGLSRWSLWYQVRRFGAVPWQMRAINLGLAALLSSLVGLLAFTMGLSGWMAAGVMALHPLMIETVATISGRAELLAAIGVVLACLCATQGWWPLVILGLFLGLLGKENAVVALALVPLTVMAGDQYRRSARVFWLGLAALVAISVWHWQAGTTVTIHESPLAWAWLQSGAAMRLITLAIVPHGLTVDYDYDALPRVWFLLSAGSLAALTWIAVQTWERWRLLSFSLAWVLVVCLPRLIVQTPKSYFNEHQFTLAMVGVAIGFAALAQQLQEWHGRWRVSLVV